MSLIRGLVENRSGGPPGIQPDPSQIPSPGTFGMSAAGIPVTERSSLQLSAVWACISLISDTIAMLPVDVFQGLGPSRAQVRPRPAFFDEPYPGMLWQDWMGRAMVSLLMRGNFYGLITARDRMQRPTAILPVHPDMVYVWRSNLTGGVTYRIMGDTYDPFDVFHIKGMTLPGGVAGLSVLEYARQAIGGGLATQEFGGRTFSEGMYPSGQIVSPTVIDPVAAKTMLETTERAHNMRSRRPMVLSGGMEFKQISISPEESQFIQSREFSVVDVARFYRVAPHMIQAVDKTTSWGKGIEEQVFGFVTFTCLPWLTRFEGPISWHVLANPQYAKYNVNGLLRGRLLERYQAYLMGRNGSWLTPDEIREKEDMAPLPDGIGGDVMQPLNMGIVKPQGVIAPSTEPDDGGSSDE